MNESPEAKLTRLMSAPAEPAPEAPKAEPAAPAAAQEPAPEPQTAEPEASQAEPADDAPSVATLAELADAIGVDVADLYALQIPVTTTEGERQEVSLGEWKDSYQAHQKTERLRVELESKRQALAEQEARAAAQIESRMKETAALLNAAENQLLSEFQGINWNELRQTDPSEWAARRQDFIERQSAINDAKQKAATEGERLQAEQASKTQAQRSEILQREAAALVAAIPEWKDETTAKTEKAELFDYLVSSGFRPDDVSSVVDHRVVVLARKAMLLDKRTKEGREAAKKLVKIAPKKVLKPGASQTKAEQQQDRVADLRGRLKKSGRVEDFAALLSRS